MSGLPCNQTYFRLLARFPHLGGCVTNIQVVDRKMIDAPISEPSKHYNADHFDLYDFITSFSYGSGII